MRLGGIILLLLGAGCAPVPMDGPPAGRSRGECGPAAALRVGAPEEYRERPPACALPGPDELARGCAVADALNDPAHRWPEQDETGMATGGDPLPDYSVSQVDCAFAGRYRNRARCSFTLARPDGEVPVRVSANLTHTFYADHGPAHHIYSTFWSVDSQCAAEGQG